MIFVVFFKCIAFSMQLHTKKKKEEKLQRKTNQNILQTISFEKKIFLIYTKAYPEKDGEGCSHQRSVPLLLASK